MRSSVGSLRLDLQHALGEVLQLARRVERLQPFEEALQVIELAAAARSRSSAGISSLPQQGRPVWTCWAAVTTFSVSSLALARSCLTASSCVSSLRISPSASPSNSNRATNSASGRPLGFSMCLNWSSCSTRRLGRFAQVGGVELLAGQAQGDVAVLDQRQRGRSAGVPAPAGTGTRRSTSFLTVTSSLRLTTWPGGLPSSFSSTALA